MKTRRSISTQTRNNWLIDLGLFLSALAAMLSGVYFLYLPTGGYQGGRNPAYNIHILFDRHTWEDIHMWGGIAMIGIALVHLVIHWTWVVNMVRRAFQGLVGQGSGLNARGRWNLVLNSVVALSFLLTALSGIYFLFFPGEHGVTTATFLFARNTWDLIHTWSAITLIAAAILHFAIHWPWVVKVTGKVIAQVWTPRSPAQPAAISQETL